MCSPHKQHTHSIEKNEAAAVFLLWASDQYGMWQVVLFIEKELMKDKHGLE